VGCESRARFEEHGAMPNCYGLAFGRSRHQIPGAACVRSCKHLDDARHKHQTESGRRIAAIYTNRRRTPHSNPMAAITAKARVDGSGVGTGTGCPPPKASDPQGDGGIES
jgi:hypothetical protein